MRKILLMLFVVFMFIGCATIDKLSFNHTAERVSAIELGYRIAKNNPEIVKQILPYAYGLLTIAQEGKLTQEQLNSALMLLSKDIEQDPIVLSLIHETLNQIKEPIEKNLINKKIIELMQAFISGLKAGTK